MGFLEWMAGCRAEKPMPKLLAFGLPEPKACPPMPPVAQPLKPRLRMSGGIWVCSGDGVKGVGLVAELAYDDWYVEHRDRSVKRMAMAEIRRFGGV